MTRRRMKYPAISCGHCTATIERELKFVDGVEGVKAELETKRVTVDVSSDDVLAAVEEMLAEIGYPAAA